MCGIGSCRSIRKFKADRTDPVITVSEDALTGTQKEKGQKDC